MSAFLLTPEQYEQAFIAAQIIVSVIALCVLLTITIRKRWRETMTIQALRTVDGDGTVKFWQRKSGCCLRYIADKWTAKMSEPLLLLCTGTREDSQGQTHLVEPQEVELEIRLRK